jgi:hypothetical protein
MWATNGKGRTNIFAGHVGKAFQPNELAENEALKNSMVRVRERTTPTERPPLVGEVISNFCG